MVSQKFQRLGGCAALALAMAASACTTAVETTATAAPATQAAGPGKIEVSVLSSRYNLVSGGDALVEIMASEGATASDLRVYLNGRNLTTPLKFDQPTNTLRGLVTGLDDGVGYLLDHQLLAFRRHPPFGGVDVHDGHGRSPVTGPLAGRNRDGRRARGR
jgi:hypothetical protein